MLELEELHAVAAAVAETQMRKLKEELRVETDGRWLPLCRLQDQQGRWQSVRATKPELPTRSRRQDRAGPGHEEREPLGKSGDKGPCGVLGSKTHGAPVPFSPDTEGNVK